MNSTLPGITIFVKLPALKNVHDAIPFVPSRKVTLEAP